MLRKVLLLLALVAPALAITGNRQTCSAKTCTRLVRKVNTTINNSFKRCTTDSCPGLLNFLPVSAQPLASNPRCSDAPTATILATGFQGSKWTWEAGVAYCLSFAQANYVFFTEDGGYTEVYCYAVDPYNGANPNGPCNSQCAAVQTQGATPSFPCGDGNSGNTGIVYTLNRPGPYTFEGP